MTSAIGLHETLFRGRVLKVRGCSFEGNFLKIVNLYGTTVTVMSNVQSVLNL